MKFLVIGSSRALRDLKMNQSGTFGRLNVLHLAMALNNENLSSSGKLSCRMEILSSTLDRAKS